jgi:hypothetical protein
MKPPACAALRYPPEIALASALAVIGVVASFGAFGGRRDRQSTEVWAAPFLPPRMNHVLKLPHACSSSQSVSYATPHLRINYHGRKMGANACQILPTTVAHMPQVRFISPYWLQLPPR